ncbi:hypothetical protein C8J55DRAFT_286788 [Lentinula edodes]|uniref:Uncharacterized protein n=1 Tax=Lentinula lateritia TaxID=40482 RepID=A0A9W8ZQJ0_9AGAR|nr:hypothetical protein C8J55DRAFT_286788 [Lentinula edodes]
MLNHSSSPQLASWNSPYSKQSLPPNPQFYCSSESHTQHYPFHLQIHHLCPWRRHLL